MKTLRTKWILFIAALLIAASFASCSSGSGHGRQLIVKLHSGNKAVVGDVKGLYKAGDSCAVFIGPMSHDWLLDYSDSTVNCKVLEVR